MGHVQQQPLSLPEVTPPIPVLSQSPRTFLSQQRYQAPVFVVVPHGAVVVENHHLEKSISFQVAVIRMQSLSEVNCICMCMYIYIYILYTYTCIDMIWIHVLIYGYMEIDITIMICSLCSDQCSDFVQTQILRKCIGPVICIYIYTH